MPGLKNVLATGGKEEDVLAVVFDEMKTVLLVVIAAGVFLRLLALLLVLRRLVAPVSEKSILLVIHICTRRYVRRDFYKEKNPRQDDKNCAREQNILEGQTAELSSEKQKNSQCSVLKKNTQTTTAILPYVFVLYRNGSVKVVRVSL